MWVGSGFFVLRTPLLPLDTLADWGTDLRAPRVDPADEPTLTAALAEDRIRLRAGLGAWLDQPEVREALYLASGDLYGNLALWRGQPDSPRGEKIERALAGYLTRMCTRTTPFSTLAGNTLGQRGARTALRLAPRAAYQRHTRLDFVALAALARAVGDLPGVADQVRLYPNSSLYTAGEALRLVDARRGAGGQPQASVVQVARSEALDRVLDAARQGQTRGTLAALLVDDEISLDDACAYIDELTQSGLLVSDLPPAVTGEEPGLGLARRLRDLPAAAAISGALDALLADLARLDGGGVGVDPVAYAPVADALARLPGAPAAPAALHVGLTKPADAATLDARVEAELLRAVGALWKLALPNDALAQFRARFVARYGDAAVPLGEALDPDLGVGFEPADDRDAPLIGGLVGAPGVGPGWTPRDALLLRKLGAALASGGEIALDPADLDGLQLPETPVPDAMYAIAAIAAPSEDAVAAGAYRLHLRCAVGPSGGRLFGRFCFDEALAEPTRAHLREEEALRPEAIYAEVVHLPSDTAGNVVARPVLRGYEIPYLGRSGAPLDRQIPLDDLVISVQGSQVVLCSRRLGRPVIPRLTSAHHYLGSATPVYKFLCVLQQQGIQPGLFWTWGPLAAAPRLPRVRCGKVVLALAQWNLDRAALAPLQGTSGAAAWRAVQALRRQAGLPRWVRLVQEDTVQQEFVFDLDNTLSVDALAHQIGRAAQATLVELFPPPDALLARGPEGGFLHELITPIRRASGSFLPAPQVRLTDDRPPVYDPGSDVLCAQLDARPRAQDELLRGGLGALLLGLDAGVAWSFERLQDHKLQFVFRGAPERLLRQIWPAVRAAAAPARAAGRVGSTRLLSWAPDPRLGEAALALGQARSRAALLALRALDSEARDDRWRLTLQQMDALLTSLGLQGAARRDALGRVGAAAQAECRADDAARQRVRARLRGERAGLVRLLEGADAGSPALARALAALDGAPPMPELPPGADPVQLAAALLPAEARRLLRQGASTYTFALCEMLTRLDESKVARERSAAREI